MRAAEDRERDALLEEALADLEHTAAERDRQQQQSSAVRAELERELDEVRGELLLRDQELRATRYMAQEIVQELDSARTQLATAVLEFKEHVRAPSDGPLWDESRGLNMEVLELSAALEAERRRTELVAMALDHAQRRLDEANDRLERQKKEKEKSGGFQPGMSRAQELQSLKEQLQESRAREDKSIIFGVQQSVRVPHGHHALTPHLLACCSQCAACTRH